jgi:UDPglucose 6-dehydrogenase
MGVCVTCIDIDSEKISKLNQGKCPIYEPGLEEMIKKNVESKRLCFITDINQVIDDVSILFIAVGTPPFEDGSADLTYVLNVARTIGRSMNNYILVVTKSTVPVGTSKIIKTTIQEELDKREVNIEFDVASNPEFLKEGDAINDFMSPDRVVVGIDCEKAKAIMTRLYRPFLLNNFRVIFMDIPSAELTKYAANSMLANRISFMNEIANLCELVGADVNMIRKGIGTDQRIGNKFLYAGCGYGGSCFPKDVKALIHTAEEKGYEFKILKAVEDVNNLQKTILYHKLMKYYDGNVVDKTIAIWGLSFKPNTDDTREAPALILIELLLNAGAKIRVYDPVAIDEAKKNITVLMKNLPTERIYFANNEYDALNNADALLLVTEWKEFRIPNWSQVKHAMKNPLVIDGRNIYNREELNENGIEYIAIGM